MFSYGGSACLPMATIRPQVILGTSNCLGERSLAPIIMARVPSARAHAITEQNIEDIVRLQQQAEKNRTGAERLADVVARVAGNTPFIILHLVWFAAWILLNLGAVPAIPPWDPFPFSFLTLVVSLEAIFLSLLVLMAQNRLTQDADKRAHLDLQINMLAEQESTATLKMLEQICHHLGITDRGEDEQELAAATDVNELAKSLDDKLTAGR
ncbi:MAG: DUF1003 domain-containing protein [Betaproteobacteria bacterium]|nr:MAG: DUF1003 domain-containing protein [Betaproteobacteria bacterium]